MPSRSVLGCGRSRPFHRTLKGSAFWGRGQPIKISPLGWSVSAWLPRARCSRILAPAAAGGGARSGFRFTWFPVPKPSPLGLALVQGIRTFLLYRSVPEHTRPIPETTTYVVVVSGISSRSGTRPGQNPSPLGLDSGHKAAVGRVLRGFPIRELGNRVKPVVLGGRAKALRARPRARPSKARAKARAVLGPGSAPRGLDPPLRSGPTRLGGPNPNRARVLPTPPLSGRRLRPLIGSGRTRVVSDRPGQSPLAIVRRCAVIGPRQGGGFTPLPVRALSLGSRPKLALPRSSRSRVRVRLPAAAYAAAAGGLLAGLARTLPGQARAFGPVRHLFSGFPN